MISIYLCMYVCIYLPTCIFEYKKYHFYRRVTLSIYESTYIHIYMYISSALTFTPVCEAIRKLLKEFVGGVFRTYYPLAHSQGLHDNTINKIKVNLMEPE